MSGGWQRGSIVKEPSGRYMCRWRDAKRDKRYKGGFVLKRDAQAYLDEQIGKARRGEVSARDITLADFVDLYLSTYDASPARITVLRDQLAKATGEGMPFNDRAIRSIHVEELLAWRQPMSPPTRWQATQAIKQVLAEATVRGHLDQDPSAKIKNKRPPSGAYGTFEGWAEVNAVAAEMPPRFDLIPALGVSTGLMPQEWTVLEGRHVDLAAGVIRVEQALTSKGIVEQIGKHSKMKRAVPIRAMLRTRLADLKLDPDEPLFPGERQRYMDTKNWRSRIWHPAFEAAGVPRLRPYDMRHTYAAWSLRAGVNIYTLGRRMATSVAMIEKTYGDLVSDAVEHETRLLDEYDAHQTASRIPEA